MRRAIAAIAIGVTGMVPLPATAQASHTCFGEPATVVGTSGNDELSGDVVVGLAGEDDLSGRLVCGGKDGDRYLDGYMVNGGPGDEREIFLDGPLAIGGAGNDKFWDVDAGGAPPQVWRGGEGNDTFIPAGSGDDVFYGGAGDDRTSQGQGAFSGKKRQFGGAGNDNFFGGGGKDKLFGEDGDDTLRVFQFDSIEDLVDGGAGFDTCVINAGDRAVNCEDVTVVS